MFGNKNDMERQMRMMSQIMGGMTPNGGIGRITKIMGFLKKYKRFIVTSLIITPIMIIIINILLSEKEGKYLITDLNGEEYNTEQYELTDGCIKFNRNKKNQPIVICGNFKIETKINK